MKWIRLHWRIVLIKILVIAVTAWNLQAAFAILIDPIAQLPNFLLGGQVGVIVLLSMGVLFLMWNVPYLFTIFMRKDWIPLLRVIAVMQLVGVIGELWIMPLTINLLPIKTTITRYLWFDLAGLLVLIVANILAIKKDNNNVR